MLTPLYLLMMLTASCFTHSTVNRIQENMKSYAKGYVIQYYVPYVKTQHDDAKLTVLKHLEDNLLLITSEGKKEKVNEIGKMSKGRTNVSTGEDKRGHQIRDLSAKVDSNGGLLVIDAQNLMKAVSRDVEDSLEHKVRSLSDKVDSNDGLLVIDAQNLMRVVSRDVEDSLEHKVRSLSDKVDSNDGLLVIDAQNLMRAVSRDVEDSLEHKVRSLSEKVDSNDGLLVIDAQNLMRAVSRDVEDSLEHKVRSLSEKVDSNDGLLVIDAQNLMRVVSRDVEDSLDQKVRSLSDMVDSNDGLLVIDAQNLMRAVSRDVEDSLEHKVRSLSEKVDSNDGLLVIDAQNLMRAVSRDVEDSLEHKVRSLSEKVDSNDGLLVIDAQNLMRVVSRDVEDSLDQKVRSLSDMVDSNDGLLVSNPQNLMRAVSRDVEDSLDQKVRSLSEKVDSNDGLLVSNPQNLMRAVSRDVEDSLDQKVRSLSDMVDSNDGLLVSSPQNLMKAVSRDVEDSLVDLQAIIDRANKTTIDNAQLYKLLKGELLTWFQYHVKHDHMRLQNLDIDSLINWLTLVHNSRRNISNDDDSFYQHWNTSLPILSDTFLSLNPLKPLSTNVSLSLMGLTDSFMNLYWPFRRDINLMNQKLAVKGFRGKEVSDSQAKKAFFEDIQHIQPIRLPVKDEIVLVFNDEDIANWLNVTGVMSLSSSYMSSKKHIFTVEEQRRISTTAHAAFRMINNSHPELYDAMTQLISCIAFYKQEHKINLAGGGRSALGMLWMDPSVGRDWSVPFMAEQIVHEFTHNALNYAEFVHGTYNDKSALGKAEVKSAIRLVPRPYDKSLHAAYVSAGLVTFHSRTGYVERAAQLTETLPQAVRDLATVEAEDHVLDGSGKAIVKFLTDYMYLTRL